jgi:hypothetical protein
LIASGCPGSHDLNFSNRPVRTRMPGGVAGARPILAVPYADPPMDIARPLA